MFNPEAIYQRTEAGRDEIYKKTQGLTQSERLVLIMIDGVTPYQGIRSKLPVLKDERFHKALLTLQKKDLVAEVFLQLEDQQAEQLDLTVIERFLQQEPLDPVTIISLDPDEEFGIGNGIGRSNEPLSVPQEKSSFAPLSSADQFPMGAPVNEPMRRSEVERAVNKEPVAIPAIATEADQALEKAMLELTALAGKGKEEREHRDRDNKSRAHRHRHEKEDESVLSLVKDHWGYVLIGVGVVFIVGFILGKVVG